jgi:hypothetical protein
VDGRSRLRRSAGVVLVIAAVTAGAAAPLGAFSVLTHETIVDAVWTTDLVPALRARYPHLSTEALREAHAYAYGGCLIQDMGYYPFGSKLFTDLAHYVRSGDFVEALLRDARDVNEYAFALGALGHYLSDTVGHPAAVNRAVAILYPKLLARFGADVTYAEDRAAHIKTEFGFDVVQVAKGHFAPEAYHDFIGFEVAKPLLERAFEETYGVPMKDLFASEDLAIGSYRRAVSGLIPEMTKVAWQTKEKDIVAATPGITRDRFIQVISRAAYEREWGAQYERPGVGARFLAFLLRIVPKIGPFKALAFKPSTPETERLYMDAFTQTVEAYRGALRKVRAGSLSLGELDLDTGHPARSGEYQLADRAFEQLLKRLAERRFEGLSADLRARILEFYQAGRAPIPVPLPASARR